MGEGAILYREDSEGGAEVWVELDREGSDGVSSGCVSLVEWVVRGESICDLGIENPKGAETCGERIDK